MTAENIDNSYIHTSIISCCINMLREYTFWIVLLNKSSLGEHERPLFNTIKSHTNNIFLNGGLHFILKHTIVI